MDESYSTGQPLESLTEDSAVGRSGAGDGAQAPLHDIVVLSDLHLGRGKNAESGRYFLLEAFFYDEDLKRFCEWLCAKQRPM